MVETEMTSIRRLLRYHVEKLAESLGSICIPKWKLNSYLISQKTKHLINDLGIDCILDVGANIGQYRDFLRNEVGYKGLIISFEPAPNIAQNLLEKSVDDDLWVVMNLALGKTNGCLDFNLMHASEFNSFLEPDMASTAIFASSNTIVDKVKVQVRRLDTLLAELEKSHNFNSVFLKLDTQGYDIEVFEGVDKYLDRISAIQSELSMVPIYKDMPSFSHSIEIFKDKGYEVSAVYAVDEFRYPHAIEFDCIFISK